jgi:hypothetical protein
MLKVLNHDETQAFVEARRSVIGLHHVQHEISACGPALLDEALSDKSTDSFALMFWRYAQRVKSYLSGALDDYKESNGFSSFSLDHLRGGQVELSFESRPVICFIPSAPTGSDRVPQGS